MAFLESDKDVALWPKPDWLMEHWPSQTISHITLRLAQALGYMAGRAPISDEVLETYEWNSKAPFQVPVNVVLNDEYRGDCIMTGLNSPSENNGPPHINEGRGLQHWNARSYIVHQNGDMGAVIGIEDSERTPGSIDICELQALMILLDRQTVYHPEKAKLRAWVVSVKPDYLRALEAYVDQSVDRYTFHFSIVGETTWEERVTRNLESTDPQ
ncbi:hypothetical protein PG997_010899 [Apiospora hydei]|uniref:Uncharacterized protein n=1 Tax=Apiospora hydei TaxID=1337664 RepID=A0ABR1VHI4_9PEZI